MKLYTIEGNYREETRVQRKSRSNQNLDERKFVSTRKRKITPISQEVMEYYENLLKEHNEFGARQSTAEYRIF
jgi:hypothetical protein